MHRGSSKGSGETSAGPEILPLSASPGGRVRVEIEVARAGRSSVVTLEVPAGTTVRTLLRQLGQAPEGSAVLVRDTPISLDTAVETDIRLTVVPTFSGG